MQQAWIILGRIDAQRRQLGRLSHLLQLRQAQEATSQVVGRTLGNAIIQQNHRDARTSAMLFHHVMHGGPAQEEVAALRNQHANAMAELRRLRRQFRVYLNNTEVDIRMLRDWADFE